MNAWNVLTLRRFIPHLILLKPMRTISKKLEIGSFLNYAVWAYRTSQRGATGVTPFQLVYGHDPVIPAELYAQSARIARQMDFTPEEYR